MNEISALTEEAPRAPPPVYPARRPRGEAGSLRPARRPSPEPPTPAPSSQKSSPQNWEEASPVASKPVCGALLQPPQLTRTPGFRAIKPSRCTSLGITPQSPLPPPLIGQPQNTGVSQSTVLGRPLSLHPPPTALIRSHGFQHHAPTAPGSSTQQHRPLRPRPTRTPSSVTSPPAPRLDTAKHKRLVPTPGTLSPHDVRTPRRASFPRCSDQRPWSQPWL